jgi:hypothetical protein
MLVTLAGQVQVVEVLKVSMVCPEAPTPQTIPTTTINTFIHPLLFLPKIFVKFPIILYFLVDIA